MKKTRSSLKPLAGRVALVAGATRGMPAKRGLIVEVTENDMIGGGGNPMSQAVKMAQKVLPLLWAAGLAPHGITVMAVTPGFLRSESMLQHFGVTEDNWREAGKKDPNFLQSESPLFVGRAIAAIAADPKVQTRTGMLFGSWELGRDYGLSDYDGRRPDWGRHKIEHQPFPPLPYSSLLFPTLPNRTSPFIPTALVSIGAGWYQFTDKTRTAPAPALQLLPDHDDHLDLSLLEKAS